MYCTLSLTLTGLTVILQPDILFALIHTVLHCKGMCILGLHHILHAHLVGGAGSVMINKSPSPLIKWSGIYYTEP